MTDRSQQMGQNQPEQNAQNVQNEGKNQKQEELSEADKQVYDQIFSSLSKMDKKVRTAKSKMENKDSNKKEESNLLFKQMAQKLIQSKQNSQIVNREDLSSDISQSFQRNVIDIYSENQKLKKKQIDMEKVIKQQNHKIFEYQTKEQNYIKQIEKLRFQLAQFKDQNLMVNRSQSKPEVTSDNKKQQPKKGVSKFQSNQANQDYDFWSMPQNESYSKKKKQFVQNSGLWVNQKNVGQSMFVTEGRP